MLHLVVCMMETPKYHQGSLETYDYVAVGIYYVVVLTVSVYSACRANRNTLSGYFLAGRYMHWFPVGASLFASNIGSEHFIGLAGSGAAAGIAVGAFELNALILLQVLGWIFLPVFIASGVCTLPEYMMKRFGGTRIRVFLASLSLILYIFTKISVNIYSGSLFIQQAVGWNIWYSILLLLCLTYICSAIGGLAAVIYMETVQFFIIIAGSLIVMVTGFMAVGGWNELTVRYLQAVPNDTFPNTTCGIPRQDSWIMLRNPINSDMPWPGFLLGQTPSSIWYWCADQLMVQRTLAAKSLSHAQGGTLLAGYIKILPVFIMVLPGMISRVLFPDEIACVKPEICEKVCGNPVSCSNSAYPHLVLGILPSGLRGVMLAVMLAALMSDLSSVFNSASTLFTMDMWKRARKQATTKELLIVSKIFTAVLVVISIIWIPIIQKTQGGQLYIYIQSIGAYLAPPIAAIYCLALTWSRVNEQGAFWGLVIGLFIGFTRMALDFSFPEPRCYEEDTRPLIISKVHYMYFAMLLFWTTLLLVIAISLFTKPTPEYRLIRTTYRTRFDQRKRKDDDQPLRAEELELMMAARRKAAENEIDGDVNKLPDKSCEKPNLLLRLFRRVCGVETKPEIERRIARDAQDRLDQINSLEQTPREKCILNTCLAVIIMVAVGLYAFFSVSPLSAEETEYLRMEAFNHSLYHGNSTS
ncbi:sodium/glucose cotransporter 5-like isoform X3 [Zootermopsis nevadensis]|uniref:sodium/glucose cotransporter 5-like isoform X3 n=1 Tax=Zootermopsis nevadensis TaxID=136037 RepID=UPI000B8EB780|nr:sodium/glucose cotransporter 5-like isoform X3 [Zootermopsis nevadensis]